MKRPFEAPTNEIPLESAHRYARAVRRPETIRNIKDFFTPEGPAVHHWLPRRYDIRRYIHFAQMAHEQSHKSGPIRILDLGGGSGFLGKLIADEARQQGLNFHVVVMDPDTDAVEEARDVFADTANLTFERGSAIDAVAKYGPRLNDEDTKHLRALEERYAALAKSGTAELHAVQSVRDALVAHQAPREILAGHMGAIAQRVFLDAGASETDLDDTELTRSIVEDFYTERFLDLSAELSAVRNEQEHFATHASTHEPEFDVVLNSWMPIGVDLTRAIHLLSPPVIIYARPQEGSGMFAGIGRPEEVTKETSFDTGELYDHDSALDWPGVSAAAIRMQINENYPDEKDSFPFVGSSRSEIQIRKGVNIPQTDREVFHVRDEEKYPWEASLEEYIGEKETAKLPT